jgi:hypothetical protein
MNTEEYFQNMAKDIDDKDFLSADIIILEGLGTSHC